MGKAKDKSFNEIGFHAKHIVDEILLSIFLENLEKHHENIKVKKTKDGYDIFCKPKKPIEFIKLNFVVTKDGAEFVEAK